MKIDMTKRNPQCTTLIRNFNAKRVVSSWAAMDTKAYSHAYEPETRPEFQCFVGGQAKAMADEYQRKVDAAGWQDVINLFGKNT